ncbi:MAG: hypothetical protein JKY00_03010 [Roseicyclus sp.]|nr:hypothetical protein [Roseicyclus sp.]
MIRVAVSGYGWWGQHIAKRLESGAGFDLAGVFAPDLTGPAAGGRNIYPSFEAILDDASVEAVILTCPNDQHEPQSVAAAGAGNLGAFADAIYGRADYPFTAAQMVHNIDVLEAIAASARSGETVRL